ncbi:MAG: hypothetical protein GX669_07635 [Lactobacillus sp.]|nr:hypothetical protein [Lactobacillus sp.]
MERKIKQQVTSHRTKDGAGVGLVRGMENTAVDLSNPVLILSITSKG